MFIVYLIFLHMYIHNTGIFSCFGFLSLYLGAKLQCCRPAGRSQGWRLCAVITPLMAAFLVAITRLQDHKHHVEGELEVQTIHVITPSHQTTLLFFASCKTGTANSILIVALFKLNLGFRYGCIVIIVPYYG